MLYKFVKNTVRAQGREHSRFGLIFVGGRVNLRCSMHLWKVILVIDDVVWIPNIPIKEHTTMTLA